MADSQRKSYNLFDKDNADIRQCYVWNDRNYVAASQNTRSVILACKPNTTYTVSKTLSDRFALAYTNTNPTLSDDTPAYGIVVNNDATSLTITTGGSAQYLVIFFIYIPAETKTVEEIVATIMVNEGQTAKSYEPYGWVHSLRKLTTATESVENPLYSDGTAITAYTIKGNEEHTGSPSPSNPVMPNGVGNKTANLFNLSAYSSAVLTNCTIAINDDILTQTNSGTLARSAWKIDGLQVGTDYTMAVKITNPNQTECQIRICDSTNSSVIINSSASRATSITLSVTFTAATSTHYIRIYSNTSSATANTYSVEFSEIMLNTGSTALPYEPYGQYKIPISTLQRSAVNYLGSVQSTRQIKKLVLTGTEDWIYQSDYNRFLITISDVAQFVVRQAPMLCTHYQVIDDGRPISDVPNNSVYFNNKYLCITTTDQSSKTDLNNYLAAQYANGTPVTVWYVLATEETGIVNEPLMKVGTYADTLSNAVSIPTTEGANSITVDTTVQPSEFTATWTGWHDSSVKEYDGTNWQ